MQQNNWWRGAVIYQVYPRSFMDSNNDGLGDLQGIISKLDYISALGVDAVWISPFFKSPQKDFGYDVSDYRDVADIYGQLSDFDELINKAHDLGLKIIIDQVLSHTSDQHAWFTESRSNRDNEKADWYVWADAKEDGSPPNNWLAIFGGSAWQWDPQRKQYFLHNFLPSQPDLNFHNPAVQQQMLEEVEFWLKRGVDGFRLDAINFCFHDQQLRDNPAKPEALRRGLGFSVDNPYAYQYHYYNNTRPENVVFLESIRQLLDRYTGTVSLGEISSEDSLKTMAEYTANDKRLHMAYSFELLVDDFSADYLRKTIETLEQKINGGWPCWSMGNHDVTRVLSRWGGEKPSVDMAKMLNALLFSLRGSVSSYQGEELGLTEVEIDRDDIQDPFGIAFWPTFKGRDGCRTPMPWDDNLAEAGFSLHKPWLPVAKEHYNFSVNRQQQDEHSVLNSYRHFLAWRKGQAELQYGDITFSSGNDEVVCFERSYQGNTLLACFNLSNKEQEILLDNTSDYIEMEGHGFDGAQFDSNRLILPAYKVFFARVLS